MGSLPTRRLIDATAKLDPADRALLNLWLNRGFDDQRLALLTGMSTEVVIARRQRLIERLSHDLELPPDNVQEALTELAGAALADGGEEPTASAAVSSSTNGRGRLDTPSGPGPGLRLGPAALARSGPAAPAGLLLGPSAVVPRSGSGQPAGLLLGPSALAPRSGPAAPAGLLLGPSAARPGSLAPAPERPEATGSGWRTASIAAVLLAVAVIVVIVALATQSGNADRGPRTRTPTANAGRAPTTSSRPAPAATTPRSRPAAPVTLAALPGGLRHARGSVALAGPPRHPRLRLTVSGLPAPRGGHYQVWLFNSVLDSRSLGRLHPGIRTTTYELSPQARRYRWIDISFQPFGDESHSGESKLRAGNPAHR